jgi:hypothetical protein
MLDSNEYTVAGKDTGAVGASRTCPLQCGFAGSSTIQRQAMAESGDTREFREEGFVEPPIP